MKVQIASIATLATMFAFATPISAGGGLISLTSEQLGPQVYLVTATVQKEDYTPCVSCKTEFFVQDLHPSKYIINPLSDKTDSEGKVSAKIALTANASGTALYYAKSQLPTMLYQSYAALLTFQQANGDPIDVLPTPYGTPNPPVDYGQPPVQATATPTSNPKLDELQNKVSDLQDKLEKSQKKQNFLEAQINNIMNFLKNIFHFGN